MSDLGIAIIEILSNSSDVTDITDQFYSDHLPQGMEAPAVVFWTVGGEGEDALDGPTGHEQSRVQMECHGKNRSQAQALWLAVHRALLGYRGLVAGCLIRSVSQSSGHYHREDRPREGSQEYRYITIQDLLFNYNAYEVT